ncbi:MAG: prepilin-type N-terminal cleavage/methylation domain-containing protein [bacterium]|nr:prepilin-type N-terminal cleavage/methylation domain-containing protein [bacterium]
MLIIRRPASRGFSIIEMLIVLAILGVLGTMSTTFLLAAKPHAELEQAELQLVAHLNAARHLALSEESQTRMRFDTTTNPDQYWVERFDAATSNWIDANMPLYNIPSGVTISGNTFSAGTVTYNTRGSLVSGGTITLSSSTGETSTFTGNLATGRFQFGAGNLR